MVPDEKLGDRICWMSNALVEIEVMTVASSLLDLKIIEILSRKLRMCEEYDDEMLRIPIFQYLLFS